MDYISSAERLRMREKQDGICIMHQTWRNLLFLHWPIAPRALREHVPAELDLDLWPDESGEPMAWIGLVLFDMHSIHLTGFPPIPGLSAFPETNVRTYVHQEGRNPGVWFFSLDAHNLIACEFARLWFGLNYVYAEMTAEIRNGALTYQSMRADGTGRVSVHCEGTHGDDAAEPDSFVFYLVERYLLYSLHGGRLRKGRVHHRPYPLGKVENVVGEQTISPFGPADASLWPIRHFSSGVEVRVFGLLD